MRVLYSATIHPPTVTNTKNYELLLKSYFHHPINLRTRSIVLIIWWVRTYNHGVISERLALKTTPALNQTQKSQDIAAQPFMMLPFKTNTETMFFMVPENLIRNNL